jgi:hypothetical protein
MVQPRTFEELVAEGVSVPVEGWDFSWFEGRANEERPPWGYARLLVERVRRAEAVLDVQTGGGEIFAEVLGQVEHLPAKLAATESWSPNLAIAERNLGRFGTSVVHVADDDALPFDDETFDLENNGGRRARRWRCRALPTRSSSTGPSAAMAAGRSSTAPTIAATSDARSSTWRR